MNRKDYSSIADFLKDEFFVQWVIHPTSESDHFWKEWIANNPSQRIHVQKAKQIISSINYQETDHLNSSEYNEILESSLNYLRAEKEKQESKGKYHRLGRNFNFYYSVAASFLVLVLFSYLLLFLRNANDPPEKLTHQPEYIHKNIPYGQKNTIRFSDGSKVKLNSGSDIKFIAGFEQDERAVYLEGEAFFDIEKDPNRPFLIKSGEVTITVTGTSFNVRAIPEEDKIKVAVVTGTVEVESENGSRSILEKNRMGVFYKKDDKISIQSFDYLDEVAWKDGILIFKNDDIDQVINKLKRWYGVEIILLNDHMEGLYSGDYENTSLEMVLEGISFAYEFDYNINDKVVTIK